MMKRIVLGVLLTSIAGAACAADLPAAAPYTKAPAIVAPVNNWTGFYIGAMGGYASESSDQFGVKGGFGGGTVGYNWQFNQFVAGLEADGAFGNIHSTTTGIVAGVPFTGTAKIDALATFRGRVGVAFDQVLLYGTAGFALADTKVGVTVAGLGFNDTKTQTGWTAGAGVEWMFIPRWSLKAEYLFRSFGSENFFAGLVPPGIPTGTVNINSGQVGINYHF